MVTKEKLYLFTEFSADSKDWNGNRLTAFEDDYGYSTMHHEDPAAAANSPPHLCQSPTTVTLKNRSILRG